MKLVWQSKLVLLLVLPFAGASVVLQGHFFVVSLAQAAIWTLGLSLLLGLMVVQLRAATPGGAFAGALLTANASCFPPRVSPISRGARRWFR
jgi:hypothetical protein